MTITTTSDYTELRDKQQKVWSSGDYNKIAALTVPVSEHLVEHVGVAPGSHVLDVATGTGHVALAAARRSAVTTGIDYVPELLEIARRRAAAEDLDIDFAEADAENLPYGDESFDFVLSAIGVMFSADHAQAARELVRVTRPGGRIALASWTPEGFVGGMLADRRPARHAARGRPAADAMGHGGRRRRAPRRRCRRRRLVHATVRQRFADAEAFADLFLTYYGPDVRRGRPARRRGSRGAPRGPGRARPGVRPRHRLRRGPRLGVPHRHGDPPLTTRHTTTTETRKRTHEEVLRSPHPHRVLLAVAGLVVASTATAGAAELLTGERSRTSRSPAGTSATGR